MCVVRSRQMKKPGSDKEITSEIGPNFATEAAELDRVVTRIIRTLRSGKPARLPGLGTLKPGKQWTFLPERFTATSRKP